MNKKPLILTIISLIVTFAVIGGIFYLQSFKTIHFDLKKENMKVTVYKGTDTVTSFNADTDIRLQKGEYSFTTDGNDYTNTPTSFTVLNNDMSVTVDPPYSDAYRNRVLNAELPAITKVLTQAYPILSTDFTIGRGDIYDDGSWYGTTLTQKPNSASEQGDVYHTILRKEKGVWVIKTKPAIVLDSKVYSNIPFEILTTVNGKE